MRHTVGIMHNWLTGALVLRYEHGADRQAMQ